MYTNCECSFHVSAAPGNSLLTKVVSCTVSVVKADCEVATNHVQRGISISVATNMPFLVNRFVTFLLDCTFGNMLLLRLKSGIPAGFCKLNRARSFLRKI